MTSTERAGPAAGDEPGARKARRQLLDLLGLAARAGEIVTGTESVRGAVRENSVYWVILAEDAAPGQQQKVTPLLEARGVPFHIQFTRDELGAAVGRGQVSAIGITDRGFSGRVGQLAAQLGGGASRRDRGGRHGSTHEGGL